MDDALRRLGIRIRELRTQRGWSQEAFADVAGVHRTYMGHLERGEKNVSFLSILRVANALGITLSELLAGLEKYKRRSENRPVNAARAASLAEQNQTARRLFHRTFP